MLPAVVLDPAFATNRWVYLYYAPAGGTARNVLPDFTMNGDSATPAPPRSRSAR